MSIDISTVLERAANDSGSILGTSRVAQVIVRRPFASRVTGWKFRLRALMRG